MKNPTIKYILTSKPAVLIYDYEHTDLGSAIVKYLSRTGLRYRVSSWKGNNTVYIRR